MNLKKKTYQSHYGSNKCLISMTKEKQNKINEGIAHDIG